MADIKITQYDPVVQNDLVDTTLMEVVNSGSGGTRDNYKASLAQLRTYYEKRIVDGTIDLTTLTVEGNTILARDGGNVGVGGSTGISGLFTILQNAESVTGGLLMTNADNTGSAGFYRKNGTSGSFVIRNTSVDTIYLSGGSVGIGRDVITSGPRLVVADGVGTITDTLSSSIVGLYQNNANTGDTAILAIMAGATGQSRLALGNSTDWNKIEFISYQSSGILDLNISGSQVARWTDAGHFLVNTTSDPGETVHFNGSVRQTGSLSYMVLNSNGAEVDFYRDNTNYLAARTVGGHFAIITNGRSIGTTNANVLFNPDLSSTFYGNILINTSNPTILGGATAGSFLMNAGNSLSNGGNIALRGSSYAGIPSSVELRTDSTAGLILTNNAEVLIGYTTDQGAYKLQVNGACANTTGAWTNLSDARFKTNIRDIEDPIGKAIAIADSTKHFEYIDGYGFAEGTRTQYIAQLLEENGLDGHVDNNIPDEEKGVLLGWEYADEEYTDTETKTEIETYTEIEIQTDEEGNEVEIEVEKEREIEVEVEVTKTRRVVVKEGDLLKTVEQNFAPYAFPAIKALKEEIDLLKAEISAIKGE